MATVTLTVCDVCGKQDAITTYTVEANGKMAVADLCSEHAAALIEFLDGHAVKPQSSSGGRGTYRHTGRYRSTISTLEEIEATKKREAKAKAS